jgi:hypothetical protein
VLKKKAPASNFKVKGSRIGGEQPGAVDSTARLKRVNQITDARRAPEWVEQQQAA